MSCINPLCTSRKEPLAGNIFCEVCRGKAAGFLDGVTAAPEGCEWEGARLFVVVTDRDSVAGLADRFGVHLDDLKIELARLNPRPPPWQPGARFEVPASWATLKRVAGRF